MNIHCRAAQPDERDDVLSTLLLGFATDPVMRWIWPTASAYSGLKPMFDAFGGAAVDSGSAYVTDNIEGASFWLKPGVEPDGPTLKPIMEDTVPEPRRSNVRALFAEMDSHHPTTSYWYLSVIAVDPVHQGRGFGSSLLRYALSQVDTAGEAAYLEATSEANRRLYERHGFETQAEVSVGSSPPVFPMVRVALAG